jgi:hypothetical protein
MALAYIPSACLAAMRTGHVFTPNRERAAKGKVKPS